MDQNPFKAKNSRTFEMVSAKNGWGFSLYFATNASLAPIKPYGFGGF